MTRFALLVAAAATVLAVGAAHSQGTAVQADVQPGVETGNPIYAFRVLGRGGAACNR